MLIKINSACLHLLLPLTVKKLRREAGRPGGGLRRAGVLLPNKAEQTAPSVCRGDPETR